MDYRYQHTGRHDDPRYYPSTVAAAAAASSRDGVEGDYIHHRYLAQTGRDGASDDPRFYPIPVSSRESLEANYLHHRFPGLPSRDATSADHFPGPTLGREAAAEADFIHHRYSELAGRDALGRDLRYPGPSSSVVRESVTEDPRFYSTPVSRDEGRADLIHHRYHPSALSRDIMTEDPRFLPSSALSRESVADDPHFFPVGLVTSSRDAVGDDSRYLPSQTVSREAKPREHAHHRYPAQTSREVTREEPTYYPSPVSRDPVVSRHHPYPSSSATSRDALVDDPRYYSSTAGREAGVRDHHQPTVPTTTEGTREDSIHHQYTSQSHRDDDGRDRVQQHYSAEPTRREEVTIDQLPQHYSSPTLRKEVTIDHVSQHYASAQVSREESMDNIQQRQEVRSSDHAQHLHQQRKTVKENVVQQPLPPQHEVPSNNAQPTHQQEDVNSDQTQQHLHHNEVVSGNDGAQPPKEDEPPGHSDEPEESYWFCGLCNQEFDDRNELLSHIMSCQGPASATHKIAAVEDGGAAAKAKGSRSGGAAAKTKKKTKKRADRDEGEDSDGSTIEDPDVVGFPGSTTAEKDSELQVSFGSEISVGDDDPALSESADKVVDAEGLQVSNGKGPLDDSALLVYHCWLCGEEYLDKLGLINHFKGSHSDVPELRGLERHIHVPICLRCGIVKSQGCQCPEVLPLEPIPADKLVELSNEDEEDQDEDLEGQNESGVSENKTVACTICGFNVRGVSQLRNHRVNKHPGEKSHQCLHCPVAFATRSLLRSHMAVHSKHKGHTCKYCHSRFVRRSDLVRHVRIHTGDKPFKCVLCEQQFTQKSSLEKHARLHAKRMGGVACELCGLIFKTAEELGPHLRAAHSDKTFQCRTCGKAFSADRYLQQHMKAHAEVKDHICGICGKQFTLRALLVRHEDRSHRTKPEIKCDQCGRTFQRRENLTRHKRSHSGIKEFRCPVCNMGFTEKGSVRRHMMSRHENLKPHACDLCDKNFSRSSLLNKHREKHHGVPRRPGRRGRPAVVGTSGATRPNFSGGGNVDETGDSVLESALMGDFRLEETSHIPLV